jgi:hypothetical protein
MSNNRKPVGHSEHRVGQEKLSAELSVRFGDRKRNYRIPYSLKVALKSTAQHFNVSESKMFRDYLPIMNLTKKMKDDGFSDDEILSIVSKALENLLAMFERAVLAARRTVH